MKSGLPPLTSLQFLILAITAQDNINGSKLRDQMSKIAGVRLVGPAFYQAMARLEKSGWIETYYDDRIEKAQRKQGQRVHVREAHYRLTMNGGAALRRTREFYQ